MNLSTVLICIAIALTRSAALSSHELGTAETVTACTICKGVSFLMDNSVKYSMPQFDTKERLNVECGKLGTHSQMCHSLVSNHFEDIWVLLQMDLETDAVCLKLGLCSSTTSVKIDLCPICESILPQVQAIVDKPSTEVEVCTLMEMFCNILPYDPAVFAACNSDIQSKLPPLWATLTSCVDNATACCIKLKACKAQSYHILDFMEDVLSSVQDNSTCPPLNCTTCEGALAQLQFIVDNNSTEQNLIDLLQLACGELPPYYQSMCSEFLQKNFSVYWDKFKTCLDNPKDCCALIGACNKSALGIDFSPKRVSEEVQATSETQPVKCLTCKDNLNTIERIVNSNSPEEEARMLMETFCQTALPVDSRTECKCLMMLDFSHARNIFRECLDSKECCTLLGMCSTSTLKAEWLSEKLEPHGCMEET